jgi:hypothetical protein
MELSRRLTLIEGLDDAFFSLVGLWLLIFHFLMFAFQLFVVLFVHGVFLEGAFTKEFGPCGRVEVM